MRKHLQKRKQHNSTYKSANGYNYINLPNYIEAFIYIYLKDAKWLYFLFSLQKILSIQPTELQEHKNLCAKKTKKTYKIICICQIFDIPLPSDSGIKPERTTNFIHLLNFFSMKHISKNSQKGLQYLHAFEIAQQKNLDNLYKVYSSFSTFKARAFRECENIRLNENATSMGYIISHNSNYFTYAFETSEGLRIETACNSYIIK